MDANNTGIPTPVNLTYSDIKTVFDDISNAFTFTDSTLTFSGVAEDSVEPVLIQASANVANFNDPVEGSISIFGDFVEDGTITVDTSTLADEDGLGQFNYQWFADGLAIANSNTNNYTLTQSEVGKEITVGVSYTDGYGTPESLISNPTDTVTNINDIPAGNIIIDGVLNQYQTLTANTNSITDEDGMGELGYQWFSNGELIEGASTNTFILSQDEVGKRFLFKSIIPMAREHLRPW